MSTLLQSVKQSLFFRLALIFGVTVLLFILIISVSLSAMNQDNNVTESIPDYFTRNIESIIGDIGAPPNLGNAMRLAQELDWSIRIRNPIMRWSSDNEYRLDVDDSVYDRTLSSTAELRTVNNEGIIVVKQEGYDFYLYQRLSNQTNSDFALTVGLALAGLVLFLNYFMVNKLLDPVRLLRKGAERIRKGDLSFRVQTNRQDELGELTHSINHMADSLQSMLEAKRQLLLAISHELRSPITKAKLRLEFLPAGEEVEQLREDIDEIDLLISDLVEAERLNGDHSVLVSEPVQFAEFVEFIAEQFIPYAGGLEVVLPDEDREFHIDKLRIRLLITNLVNNAIRHGEEKPIQLRISFSGQDTQSADNEPQEQAILEVVDAGEGIAEEHLSQLSEPFYRADSSRQRNTGGFGLGLYLCKLIAKAHGGELSIQSKVGVGTHITVRLPRRNDEDDDYDG